MPVDSRLVGLTKDGRIVGAPADADGYVRIGGAPPMHAYHKRRVAAAGDYVAGDMISNSATAASATAWKLKMGRDAGDAGHITSVWVSASVDSLTTAPHVYLFAREPDRTDTPFTDNAAFAIGARALEYYCGRITLPGLRDDGSVSHAMTTNLQHPYRTDDAGYLWAILVASTAEANESANMTVLLGMSGYVD